MYPTESSILENFLLSAVTLTSAISFDEFTDLFPESKQNSLEVELLYRELQHQRAIDADDVKHNIEAEVKRGEKMKRDVARARKAESQDSSKEGDTRDTTMEITLFGAHSSARSSKPHNLRTIQPAMVNACKELENEIMEMEAEAQSLHEGAQMLFGDLNDLRYGQFNQTDVVGDQSGQDNLGDIRSLQKYWRNIDDNT